MCRSVLRLKTWNRRRPDHRRGTRRSVHRLGTRKGRRRLEGTRRSVLRLETRRCRRRSDHRRGTCRSVHRLGDEEQASAGPPTRNVSTGPSTGGRGAGVGWTTNEERVDWSID
ncbi:Hypothetical protein SMAX5B_019440 [Scophthalmus maximus]|uniref:Uncharacterized protein n=1 Tax=Scophthalmus maximus TaxID=52904 RepID=A0A2U9CQT0_SCOMX|nr:Hypothetical protein SMAX5B_019440 [Scophthalmus maximus]